MEIPLYKTQGIVLKRINLGETDKLLTVYTQERGKILIKAKGLRKKEAKLKESLELFNHLDLVIANGRNLDTVAGALIINSFSSLKSNLASMASAHYLADVIDKLIMEPEKDAGIWHLIFKAFYFLEKDNLGPLQIKAFLNKFEWYLLSCLGYQPAAIQKSYLDLIQNISGQPIESFKFLLEVL